MISNEQIAHELAVIYLSNRYGVQISGNLRVSSGDGRGDIRSRHFPDTEAPKYQKVGTGEKGFLGIEKTVNVQTGYETDGLFEEILRNYRNAYRHFLTLLEKE